MSNLKSTTDLKSFTHLPCPAWCAEHWDSDDQAPRELADIYRHHLGAEESLRYRTPDSRSETVEEASVRLERYDSSGVAGATVVVIGALNTNAHGQCVLGGLHPDHPMSVADAALFGVMVQRVVAAAYNDTKRPADLLICERCHAEYHIDGSPSVFECEDCALTEPATR